MNLSSGGGKEGTVIYGAKYSKTLLKNNHIIPVKEASCPHFTQ
jgi:hypothetical protein